MSERAALLTILVVVVSVAIIGVCAARVAEKEAVAVPNTVASVRTVEVDGCKYVVATGGSHGVCIVHAGDCRNVLGHIGRNPLR